MRKAIRLSVKSVTDGGGPFASVIVKNDRIIASGTNRVAIDNDPTAHGEVIAIRNAARELGSFDLSGCDIYTSCEPCPMCLGAIYWARLDNLYYANSKTDAAGIGFDDSFIYSEFALPAEERSVNTVQLLRDEALEAFRRWKEKEDRIEY
ncbi:MAG: nucleoside deaminase [Bacteroidetes bacterium]|nr:nucleoside deaminase [Bacteroidota bacterium]